MSSTVNLQEFIDGYKTVDVVVGESSWRFREPTIMQLQKPVDELIALMVVDGSIDDFMDIYNSQLTLSAQQDLLKDIFSRLGLGLGDLQKIELMLNPS